ncbi:MAG: hypothetical protein IPL46_20085 [Saprospiraceae bacterium]|nr:hypothetical protein [Saprospiraceae bacterium]
MSINIFLVFLLSLFHHGLSTTNFARTIDLGNDSIQLKFDRSNGGFISLEDSQRKEIICQSASTESNSPWELLLEHEGTSEVLDIEDMKHFSFERPNEETLVLVWKGLKRESNETFEATATITLEEGQSFAKWHFAIRGLGERLATEVTFPRISGVDMLGESNLAVPHWMGGLLKSPKKFLSSMGRAKKFGWAYPGFLSMQFMALYDDLGKGFYVSCDDTAAYQKNFALSLDSAGQMVYEMENFPELVLGTDSYSLQYKAVVGVFYGDWISAAEQYREWGEQQHWSANSRLKAGLTPKWLEETALWVWNRGVSGKVLEPAVAMRKHLDLPVSVLWHWWHGCLYDDGFPEYIPPREGAQLFTKNVEWAKSQDVNALVYMNQLQWGASTNSWSNKNAITSAVKDRKGKLISHVYNIFTENALINMCITTPFWRQEYSDLSDTVINSYGVSGIYMDQACISKMCYDKGHNHSIGGGNYWQKYSGVLTDQIRSRVKVENEITLSGEGVSETMLPYLDAFLALQVSQERYGGVYGWEPIPLFQAVYHEFGITYGNYSSLLCPPYDALWPIEKKPANSLEVLDESFNGQFLMEQARSFAWGMQPMISNYRPFLNLERKEEIAYLTQLVKVRKKCLKYLLKGRFMRVPEMSIPVKELAISRLSIYAGQQSNVTTYHKEYPTIYSSAWKSDDNSLGIAIASISDELFPINLDFGSKEYDISETGEIFLIDIDGRRPLGRYSSGRILIDFKLESRGICMIEIIPD